MSSKSPDPMDVFVGGRVRLARVMACMSQETLAEALKLSFQQVQKYEKGANRIGASRLAQIAKALNRPVSWFFDEQDAKAGEEQGLMQRMLVAPGGLKLAEAYIAIEKNTVRHAVVAVVESIAGSETLERVRAMTRPAA